MDTDLKNIFENFKKFDQEKIEVKDEKTLLENVQKLSPCIKTLENIFNTNHLILEREFETVIEIYTLYTTYLLIAIPLNTRQGIYKPLNDDEWKHLTTVVHLLRRILCLDPFNEFANHNFVKVIMGMYCHNPNQNVKENLKLIKEALYVNPYSHELHYYTGRLYKLNEDAINSLYHFKMCCSIIDNLKEQTDDVKKHKTTALIEIGNLYYKDIGLGNRHLAMSYYKKAYEIDDKNPDICNCIAVIHTENRDTDSALEYYNLGLKYAENSNNPNNIRATLYMNMGLVKSFETEFEEAIKCSNMAVKYMPTLALAYQNKLLDMNYISHRIKDPMYIANQHFKLGRLYPKVVENYKESLPYYIVKNKNEKLNIGFVSGDFVCHPVAYFMNGILSKYNHDKIKIFCYSARPMDMSKVFINVNWKIINQTSPDDLEKIIKNDKIDILIDLSGHTGENRIDVFVLKPAPIQMSYLGYPNTTGLKCFDYRITDKFADCKESEKYYSEKLLYMPNCFLNYNFLQEKDKLPNIKDRESNEEIVFGSFNKFNKINPLVIKTWVEILKEIPNSKLILKTKEFQTKTLIDKFFQKVNEFQGDCDIKSRIEILPYADSWLDHLEDYNKIDYALDSFPYSGTTTSCDALLMGVAVITLKDNVKYYHSQNVTSSILNNSNLEEYIANDIEDYKKLCKTLTKLGSPDKKNIRENFLNGHVFNTKEFINDFENLLIDTYHSHFNSENS